MHALMLLADGSTSIHPLWLTFILPALYAGYAYAKRDGKDEVSLKTIDKKLTEAKADSTRIEGKVDEISTRVTRLETIDETEQRGNTARLLAIVTDKGHDKSGGK
jgi:hypothetical protein